MIQSNSGGIPAYMNVAPAGNGYNDGFGFAGVSQGMCNGFAQAEISSAVPITVNNLNIVFFRRDLA